jgi:hypothetical protein
VGMHPIRYKIVNSHHSISGITYEQVDLGKFKNYLSVDVETGEDPEY